MYVYNLEMIENAFSWKVKQINKTCYCTDKLLSVLGGASLNTFKHTKTFFGIMFHWLFSAFMPHKFFEISKNSHNIYFIIAGPKRGRPSTGFSKTNNITASNTILPPHIFI